MTEDCFLMHGEICVAEISFDPTGRLTSVSQIFDEGHMPIGTLKEGMSSVRLSEWWDHRSIPITRKGIRDIIDSLNIPSPEWLMKKSYGLSLSDSYWIRPKDEDLKWPDINYYDNTFTDDFGNMLFYEEASMNIDLLSPDCSSDGNLKKKWTINNGKRVLIKGGSGPYRQEPFNEVITSEVCRRLGIDHIHYDLIYDRKEPCCICDAFTSRDTELISFWNIIRSTDRKEKDTMYSHMLDALRTVGATDAEDFLDRTITLDYIIANEDRHLGNLGILRDPNTLEFKGFAPVYDSGSSLGYNTETVWIKEGYDLRCKPFKSTHMEQIRLVHDFDWLDLDSLNEIETFITSTYERSNGLVNEGRAGVIADYVRTRIDRLQEVIDKGEGFRDDPSQDIARI